MAWFLCLLNVGGGSNNSSKTITNPPPNPHPQTKKNTHTHPTTTTTSYQNYERKVPMQQDSIFRIFSQSKPVSTAAFLTLVDEVRFGSSSSEGVCYICMWAGLFLCGGAVDRSREAECAARPQATPIVTATPPPHTTGSCPPGQSFFTLKLTLTLTLTHTLTPHKNNTNINPSSLLLHTTQGRVHLDDPVSLYLPEFASVRVYNPTANGGKGGESS